MYCRLLLKLILRDKAVWISTLVLAAAFSVPIAFNSPIYGPFFMKQGMQSFVDAFNTRAPQASGTDLSPEQQNDAELARYANAALAAQTDAAFLDSAESYYALMGEGFQSGSIVGDRETNDAALAYCRALSSSGITDIPASANDLPFLSFLPYAIATAPSFLPFIPFLLSSILVLGATRPGTLAADGICQRRSAEFAELVYLSSSGSADLYPTLSAIEHLAFVREAWKSAAGIDSLCDSLGISPYLDKPTRKLSTGMKQQVKLAMAIATDCPYLILDEPLNGLDPGKRKTSCDAMRSEVARGRSVLISSHLLDDLADLTNSFYFIEAGTLVEKIKSSSQTLKQEYLDTYEGGE